MSTESEYAERQWARAVGAERKINELESDLASERAKRVEAEAKATEDQRWQAGYDEGYRDAIKENAEPASTEKETFNYVANDPGMGEDD